MLTKRINLIDTFETSSIFLILNDLIKSYDVTESEDVIQISIYNITEGSED